MDTYGSRSLARRRRGDGDGLREGHGTRPSSSPRTCSNARPDDLEFTDGAFRVRGNPEASKTHRRDRAAPCSPRTTCPTGWSPTSTREATFDPPNVLVPARHAPVRGRGGHRDRPGHDPRSYVAVDDVGKVVNPMIVEGQVHGGVAPGHRPGAVRGGRRTTRAATSHRVVRRVPAAERGRPADIRHRPDGDPGHRPIRWASRASARRAPSPRPRPSSTRSSTRCARAASTTSRCRCTPERVWRAARGQGGAA